MAAEGVATSASSDMWPRGIINGAEGVNMSASMVFKPCARVIFNR